MYTEYELSLHSAASWDDIKLIQEELRNSKTYAGGIPTPLEESPGTQSRETGL